MPNLLKDVQLNAAVVPRHKTSSRVVNSMVSMGFGGSSRLGGTVGHYRCCHW